MFRKCDDEDFEEMSEGGTRYLFQVDHFTFQDTLDGEGGLHGFGIEAAEHGPLYFEVDRATMYEIMARYLAGEYEKEHHGLDPSPTHAALMDAIEIASARARSGDPAFVFDDALDGSEDVGGDGSTGGRGL